MSPRSDRSPLYSRAALSLGVAALAVIAMAARSQSTQEPPAAPPAATTAQTDTLPTIVDAIDSMAAASPAVPAAAVMAPAPAPVPVADAWPVDPATGQTLINGQPVVGRVFIMKKVDGIEKYEYSQVYAKEAAHPEPAIVSARQNPLPARNVRRIRNAMIQATLWSMDKKPYATELRTFRPSTSGESLGQR